MGFLATKTDGTQVRVSAYTREGGNTLYVDSSGNLYDSVTALGGALYDTGRDAVNGASDYDPTGDPVVGGGGGGVSLADVALSVDGASISTPVLSLTDWYLIRIVAQIRAQDAGELSGTLVRALLRFNDDANANYLWGVQQGDGTAIKVGDAGYAAGIQALWGSGSNFSSSYFGINTYEIVRPGGNDNFKVVNYQGAAPFAATQMRSGFGAGIWQSTAPITKITLRSNDGSLLDAGTRLRVFGLAAA